MPAGREGAAREWRADKRDAVADARDAAADERDVVADERDRIAGSRDDAADAREAELDELQSRLDARAARWGLTQDRDQDDAERLAAAAARRAAESDRAVACDERERVAVARAEVARQRAADHRDTLLAATFAGVAEHLYEADDPDEVLTRIAEAAVEVITGATSASIILDQSGERASRTPRGSGDEQTAEVTDATLLADSMLSFPFATSGRLDSGPRTATLIVHGPAGESFVEPRRRSVSSSPLTRRWPPGPSAIVSAWRGSASNSSRRCCRGT